MKSETNIKRRLHQRQFRYQSRYLEVFLARKHYNCKYNAELDSKRVCVCHKLFVNRTDLVQVGRLNASVNVATLKHCDANVKGSDLSSNCIHFEYRRNKSELQDDFKIEVTNLLKNPQEFSRTWPDIVQLLWVLGEVEQQEEPQEVEQQEPKDDGKEQEDPQEVEQQEEPKDKEDSKELEVTREEIKACRKWYWWLYIFAPINVCAGSS